MVIISGDTLVVSTMMSEYPPDSAERQLLEKMSQSAGKYSFDTDGELKFELKFRKAVVDSAYKLSRSSFRFATFHKSKCSEEYWDRNDDGGFALKEGAVPAEAVTDIYRNGGMYATECATAMVIVFYGAALDIFGAGSFNKLFPDIYLMDWSDIDPLLRGVGDPEDVDDILIGDRAYFKNPDVDPSRPEWRGENVIVMPGGLYYGHGAGIRTAEEMIRLLNGLRKKDAEKPAYFLDVAARPDYGKLYRASEKQEAQSASALAHIVWGQWPEPIRGVWG